tara:strand:- start:232 stop:591 length:360 start_codon:yes stop_codon:yes gene_type:complete
LRGSPLATSGDAPLPKNVERVLGCFSFKIPGVPKQDVAKVFVADRDNVWFKSRVIGNLSPRSFINQKVLLQVSFGDHSRGVAGALSTWRMLNLSVLAVQRKSLFVPLDPWRRLRFEGSY